MGCCFWGGGGKVVYTQLEKKDIYCGSPWEMTLWIEGRCAMPGEHNLRHPPHLFIWTGRCFQLPLGPTLFPRAGVPKPQATDHYQLVAC